MPKKKIALVYDSIFPYIKGGSERRFYEIGKQLVQNGYQVHLYGMKFWTGGNTIESEGLILHGLCKARPLYTGGGRRSISQAIIFGLSCYKLLWEDFDVIDCCGFPFFSLYICKIVAVVKRKKLYATWHEVWGKEYWQEYLGWLGIIGYIVEKISVKLPDEIIAVSDHTAKALKKTFNASQPIHVINNGIHLEEIKRVEPSEIYSDVLYVGRLMDFKNIDVLLRAIGLVNKQRPQTRCVIVGDGPEREKLHDMVQKLQLNDSVVFIGFQEDYSKIIGMMKSSKIFVLPSVREGFGMVVVEANACDLPVITTTHEHNAAKELIHEGVNGFLSELNEKEIANKIIGFLENDNTLEPSRDIKQYDWRRVVKDLESVLRVNPKT